jgi:hypothetical protein
MKLLVRNPQHRLGSGEADAIEIKGHIFFHDMPWDALETGRLAPPWQPNVASSLDTSQFDQEFTSMLPIGKIIIIIISVIKYNN